MAGLEPAVSRARGVRFGRAKLHPGIGAHDEDRTRLPGSTVRSLRQMGTWAIGALGRDRTGMVSHRPLKTARLPASPRARIELENLVGLEPTVTLRRRIKNPLPWPPGAQVRDGGSGWFRTTCARVKSPLHLHSGLTLRIHRLDVAAASRSGFAWRAMMASLLAFARASAAWLSAERRCTPAGKFSVMVTSCTKLVLP